MLQPANDFGFLLKPADELRVAGEVSGQNLERDVPIEPCIIGPVDGRHSALAGPTTLYCPSCLPVRSSMVQLPSIMKQIEPVE
jgi:hypothetical protein